jgi:hypothetical protein
LFTNKPLKMTLNEGRTAGLPFTVDAAALPPGIYRIDALIGADAVWRNFFKIVP